MHPVKTAFILSCIIASTVASTCMCTYEYEPVCGTNGMTYSNLCSLNCAAAEDQMIKLAKMGACETRKSPCICNKMYEPVCGNDGMTYDNACILECQATTKTNLKIVKQGECKHTRTLNCMCNKMYDPVCGSDDVTYDNECIFECHAEVTKNLKIVKEGECTVARTANCMCNKMYDPVCGSDGVTYDNECIFECEAEATKNLNLRIVKEGECTVARKSPCMCTKMYEPVCGTDGVTYSNACMLGCKAAAKNINLKIAKQGTCNIARSSVANCLCHKMYDPVCGSDGVTYDNECIFECEAEATNNLNLRIVKEGECTVARKSPCMCTKMYEPVCGTDGVTYSNACMLGCKAATKNLNLKIAKQGKCNIARSSVDNCMCNKMYDPVCGSDGVTYGNECIFECEAEVKQNLKIVKEGECTVARSTRDSCVCTYEYKPVCGTNGVTYGNLCDLNCAASEDKKVKLAKVGPCETRKSSCMCNKMYEPVCGNDGVTYDNACVLGCEAARHNGDLKIVRQGVCAAAYMAPCMCTRIYTPVCGSDKKTYDNECMFNCAAQWSKEGLSIVHEGSC